MNILIIGGTRHMGHFLTMSLLNAGHHVTLLNRGITRNDLPTGIEYLQADRTIPVQLEAALSGREFDVVAAWSVDRLGRSLQHLVGFLNELHAKDIGLYWHQQGIDTVSLSTAHSERYR